VCNTDERLELDTADARTNFSISTAIGLLAVGISYPLLHIPIDDYSMFNNGANFNIQLLISGSIVLISVILLLRTMLEGYHVYPKVILKLFKKYDNLCPYCDFHTLLKDELDYHTQEIHGKIIVKNPEKYYEAIKYYDKVLAINPENAEAWHNKGHMLHKLGKYEEAIKCYERALEIAKTKELFLKTLCNIGNILDDLGKYYQAKEAFDKALKIDPNYADALNYKNLLLNKTETEIS
jgi:tetratricopeptide (TPR) repeat protein